jgi:hypothetical protein
VARLTQGLQIGKIVVALVSVAVMDLQVVPSAAYLTIGMVRQKRAPDALPIGAVAMPEGRTRGGDFPDWLGREGQLVLLAHDF